MKILKLSCALSLVSVLAACGTPTEQNTSSSSSSSSSSSNSSSSSSSSSGNAGGDAGSLSVSGLGFSRLPDGNGGWNMEPHEYSSNTAPNYNRAASVKAFEETLYKHLREAGCAGCHNSAGAGQAPLHADDDVGVAHDYAITRTNFADPERSRLVVRQRIERHGCLVQGESNACAKAADKMQAAVEAFADKVAGMLPSTPRPVPAGEQISESDIKQWIADDKAKLSADEKEFAVYTSLHIVHNEGVQDHKNNKPLSAEDLNIFRAGLSKALNSVARWAPEIKNPIDVNGKGILYRFDTRWYWGYNKGVTKLIFGGSDDDIAFGSGKRDYLGQSVGSANQRQTYNYTDKPNTPVSKDDSLAKLIWQRVLHGNVEGAKQSGNLKPFIDGFHHSGQKSSNAAGEFINASALEYVEVPQLVYTLTRPDVYNAIMMVPMHGHELEREVGVEKKSGNNGLDTYDWVSSWEAITIDSRLLSRATTTEGRSYWKSYDVFTGQIDEGNISIYDVYDAYPDSIRFPWWGNPIPKYIDAQFLGKAKVSDYSFIASLAQPFNSEPAGCDGQTNFGGAQFLNCRHYTGTGGLQQAATEMIWEMPNGLQGYMLTGAENQRRVDAFINIVRDPRIILDATDEIGHYIDFEYARSGGRRGNAGDPRLNNGSSCIGCHVNGMNRIGNDSGDWARMEKERPGSSPWPRGKYGIDAWKNDGKTLDKIIELYPPSSEIRAQNEINREVFLTAVTETKDIMLGDFKNTPVEPIITIVEYAQKYYKYPQTTSN